MPLVPPGSGLVLVIVGTIPTMERLKFVGPAVPAVFVALTAIVVVAMAFGVPVNKPPEERLAHPGNPFALQVIGEVPFAANWKEYATPSVPDGSGLVVVIVGATLAAITVRLKLRGPLLPAALVAVTAIVVVPVAFGVPVRSPPADSDAQDGSPVALHVIGVVPVAAN